MQSTTASGNSPWVTRSFMVDTMHPTSMMDELQPVAGLTTFTVYWGATDTLSGVASYDVQLQDNAGPWADWQLGVTGQEAAFTGEVGHTYGFRVRARDRAGNLEAWPDLPMAETTIVPRPPNDDYANAVVIEGLPYSHTQDVTGATPSADDPVPTCGPDDLTTSVWFRYTAPQNGTVRFETTGSDFYTVFLVVTGTPGNWIVLGCAEGRDEDPQPLIDMAVTAGTTYHIVVSGWYWDYGTLVFSASDQGAPPVVFEFAPTDDVQVKSDYPARNYNSTPQLRLRAPSPDIDSYLKFNVTGLSGSVQSATLRLYNTDGSGDGGAIYMVANTYRDGSVPWTETGLKWNNTPPWITGVLDTAGSVSSGTWVEWDVTTVVSGNGIYSFALSSSSTNSALYNSREAAHPPVLVIETGSIPLPPENDNFYNARIYGLDQSFTDTQNTVWATPEGVDPVPNCGYGATKTVWYHLVPASSGMVRLDTLGSDFSTVLSVWTGEPGSLVQVACSESSRFSPLDIMMSAGATYHIMIAGSSSSGGSLRFNANRIDLCSTVTQIPKAECDALLAVYNSTGGPTWTDHSGWLQTNTPCSWYGVSCLSGRVDGLLLSNNNLTGSIPPQIGILNWMMGVNLAHNQLTGPIPPEVGNLHYLEDLWLQDNELEGSIPPELGHMYALNIFDVSHNHLTGTIPPELAQMNPWYMILSDNQLEGPIPPELGQMSALEKLYMRNNRLSGDVPLELTNLSLSAPDNLDIGYNQLTASDPAVATFLNTLDPDWATTQTTAPTNLSAAALSDSSIEITWTPIAYTADGGYYEVGYSLTSGGPYTSGCTTADKASGGCVVIGLLPQTTYHIAVRTFTPLHGDQQNDLLSSWSQEASATTLGGQPVLRFTPVHDAQVKSSYPASNYGALNNLRVRYTSTEDIDSYLKFDVTSLSGPVQRATLRLYAYDGSDSGGAAYAVSNTYRASSTPWIESGIKWTNAPAITGAPLSTAGSVTTNAWIEYDVTAAITGSGTYSFAVSGTSSNSLMVYSKEAAQNRPELVIELGPGAPVAVTVAPPAGITPEPLVELTSEPTAEPTLEPTPEPTTPSVTEPAATPDSTLYVVESDDPRVQVSGSWTAHDTPLASGGRYLYSSGSPDDTLTLNFTGLAWT